MSVGEVPPQRLSPGVDRLSAIDDYQQGLDVSEQYQDALSSEDYGRAERALDMQRQQAGMATLEVMQRGGDPRYETAPIGANVDPRVEVERRFIEMNRKQQQLDQVLSAGGFGEIQKFMSEVAEAYKTRNSTRLISQPKNEEEAMQQVMQNEPVVMDPNRVANIRQMAVKLDQAMKQVDPTTSFFTNPKTKAWGEWLNREAGGGGVGYLASGEQPLNVGVIGGAALHGMELLEGATEFGINAVHGIGSLADRAIRAIGGPGSPQATNYLTDSDGKVVSNAAKAPTFMDSLTMLYAAATGRHIDETVAMMQETRQMHADQRNTLENISFGVSRVVGMGFGFGLPAGAAMNVGAKSFGALTKKGLEVTAKGMVESKRVAKTAELLGRTFGAAVGNGAAEALAYGTQDGYAKSFVHGMALAPAMMALGWMGKRSEHWLQRKNMPKRMAAALSGAVEGVGFGTMEAAEMGHLWEFIKDPNETTLETYAKNILGFMLFKGVTGSATPGERSLGAISPESLLQVSRGNARASFAERVARGEATASEIDSAPTKNVGALKELGETSIARRQAKSHAESEALHKRQKEIEEGLDVEELGLRDKSTTEFEKTEAPQVAPKEPSFAEEFQRAANMPPSAERTELIAKLRQRPEAQRPPTEKGEGPQERRLPTQEEIQEVRDMPTGHEKTQRMVHLMEMAREGRKKAIEDYAAAETRKEMDAAQELYETQDTVNRMLGGKAAPKFERAVAERVEARDKARKEIETERQQRRAYLEFKLEQLQAQEREHAGRGRPFGKLTAGEKVFDPMAVENLSAEIRKVQKELGTYKEARKLDSAQIAEMRAAQEKRGPVATTPEMLERWGRPEKAAELRAKLAAEAQSRPPEKPTEAPVSSKKAGVPDYKELPTGEGEDPKYKSLPTGAREGPGSLQVPPTRQLEATEGTEQVRASDIFSEMAGRPGKAGFRIPFTAKRVGGEEADPVRTAMRFGRVQGRGVLGLFKMYENLTRTKEGMNLVVGSHEWSHVMQRHALSDRGGMKFRDAVKAWADSLPPEAQREFKVVLMDYPGWQRLPKAHQAMEVWAEWHARNLLGDTNLHVQTPFLTRVMQQFLAAPENARIRKQYQRIQDMLHRYQAQGALGRVRQESIDPSDLPTETERATKPGALEKAWTSVRKYMTDDIVELKESQEKWLKAAGQDPSKVNIMDDPARLFDALRMTAGKTMGHFVMKGIDTPAGRIPGLKQIMKRLKGKENDFRDYIVAVRNAQLIKRGKKALLPLRDYSYAISKLQAANPEFRVAAREMKKWSDALVDYVADAGAISRESAKRIKDAYVVYAPFIRNIEGPAMQAGGRGVAERGSGLGHIKGSAFEVKDPLGALQDQALSLITKAHQHMTMSALYKMAVGKEAGGLATIVPKDVVPHTHPVKQVLDALQKKMPGMDPLFEALRDADALSPDVITLFSQQVIPTGTRGIIAFTPRLTPSEVNRVAIDRGQRRLLSKQQGELQWLEVDTKAYEVLMGVDKSPMMGWLDVPVLREIMRYPAALTRFFATGVNIGFTIANIPRDILSYSVFSKKGEFRPFSGFSQWVKGAALYINNTGRVRQLYDELGVRTSSFYSEGTRREMLGQHRTIMQQTKQALTRVLDGVKSILEAPENFLRIAEFRDAYDAAKKRGASETEARMLAVEAGREITVNFARAGILSRSLNQIIPYFNASLQGQRKVFKQLAMGGDAKTDADRARVQRAAFANAIASISVPAMFLWWLNHDEEWYQDLPEWRKSVYFNFKLGDQIISIPKPFELGVMFGSVPEAIADSMVSRGMPVDAGTLLRDTFLGYLDGPAALLPAFLRPLIEGQFNYNAFFGRRLTPEWVEKGRVPEEQATFYTTETAKILSKALGGKITPIEIEHYLGGYTAGATTSAMRMADELFGMRDHPGMTANPFVRFTKQESHGQSRYVDRLYEVSTRLDQLEGSDRINVRESQLKEAVDSAKRQISAIRKAHQQGKISREEANRRSYQIAKPLVERSKQ